MTTRLCLVTALCDPPGELLNKARRFWPRLTERFTTIAVHATTNTHAEWFDFLRERSVPVVTAEASWDKIGHHRRRSIELGLACSDANHFLYADPDHILRWAERHGGDLDRTLALIPHWDCLVVGRSATSLAATPRRLRETETIVNHIFELLTGRSWDLMMAARGLSRAAANMLVSNCRVDTIGNDTDWPLRCLAGNLNTGYAVADGLRYETNTVYATSGSDSEDDDPAAWMLRVDAAAQHIEAMRPYLPR